MANYTKTLFWYLGYTTPNQYGVTVGDTFSVANFALFDLTEIFGEGNEPSTYEDFKALFPKDYYPFDDSYAETCVSAVNGDPYRQVEVEFPSEAGTVYGGSLTIAEDGSGVLTIDKGIYTFNGSEPFALVHNTQMESFDYFRWYSSAFTNVITDWNLYNDATMSCYPVANQLAYWYSGGLGKDSVAWTIRGCAGLCIKDTRYSTVNELNEALTGQTLVYELAEPIEIQLSANQINSLYGTNNLWADSGDTEVEYRADTKLYINKKIAEAISALS